MNQLSILASTSIQDILSQNQNCGIGGGWQQSQVGNCYQPYVRVETHYIHADIAIDKVENGFLVTIKGKRYIAKKAADIPALMEAAAG